jgi:hypothetical protein
MPLSCVELHPRLTVFLLLLFCPVACAVTQPKALLDETAFDFGESVQTMPIQHEFRLRNMGSAALRIEKVALTPPLRVLRMPAQVAPGEEAGVTVGMDTSAQTGRYAGRIIIYLNDPALAEAELTFSGNVVSPVEISPGPFLFLAGHRGESATAAIEIINRIPEPLRLSEPEHPRTDRFTSRLETLDDGKRYRLTIALTGSGPGGKHADEILLKTSSKMVPVLRIPTNTYLRERVYTFPDAVDLGALPLADINSNPGLLSRNAQTLMVYQKGGTDFRITARADIPELDVSAERGPVGDRHQLTISLNPNMQLKSGAIRATILIETNDPEFPRLSVPVSGQLLGR